MGCCCGRPTAPATSTDRVAQSYYFATIWDNMPPAAASSQRRSSLCRIPNTGEAALPILPSVPGTMIESEPFSAVSLGPLLGQGGSGHVYRGTWNGATVAIKVWLLSANLFVSVSIVVNKPLVCGTFDGTTCTDMCVLAICWRVRLVLSLHIQDCYKRYAQADLLNSLHVTELFCCVLHWSGNYCLSAFPCHNSILTQ